jgi:hypothetical protein
MTAPPDGDGPGEQDHRDPDALIEALTEENKLLTRRLERERRVRREAEEIAEQGLRDLYQRQMRLETLSQLAQQLSAALTPQDIGAALSERVLDAAGATAVGLGLVGPAGRDLGWVTFAGLPDTPRQEFTGHVSLSRRSVATDAVRSGQPVALRTGAEYAEHYPDSVQWTRLDGAESTAAWPLTAGGSPFGVLQLMWAEPQPLDVAQRAFLSAVATMVSQALVRARIYADENARAAVLRSAVLPDSPVAAPGLDICVTYAPADASEGLGGDWYDVLPLPGNRTYIAVGDVVGHGLSAVKDMAQLRVAGRALAHQGLPPGQLLGALNGFARDVTFGKFATMAVAIFDPSDGGLSYSTAGHPPPLFRRSVTGRVGRLSDAHGPVLGPIGDAAYPQGRLRVGSGDILVMYTDGLVERRRTDIDTGIAEVERIVAGWDPATQADRNCGELRDLLALRPRIDDACVAALRFTGPPGSTVPPCR